MSNHKVLVYGTLKRGQPNHHVTDQPPGTWSYLGRAVTVDRWPLVVSTPFNIPFMVHNRGAGEHVIGELLAIDDEKLVAFDALEDHPQFYTREKIAVRLLSGPDDEPTTSPQETEMVWVYLLRDYRQEMMSLQQFAEYDSLGDHGLAYVKRTERQKQIALVDLMNLVKHVKQETSSL